MDNTINFTQKKYEELKKEYLKAFEQELKIFQFEGNDLDINYAKYLIQYLETKFKKV